MGAQVAHALAQAGIPHRMKSLAIQGEFGQSAYLAEDLYKKHGLTSAKIVEAAQELDALDAMAGPTQFWQGHLLLDGGKLHGSIFHRSVVLICQHDEAGALGLILNRPAGNKVGDAVVANLPQVVKEQPLYIGGPVQPGVLSFLHSDTFVPHANVMPHVESGPFH